MKTRNVAFYLVCSFILLLLGGLVSLVYVYNRDITTYSSGFTELKFQTITPGTDVGRVHDLLGKPLKTESVKPFEIWKYGETVKETKTLTGSQITFGKGMSLEFNSGGTLVHAEGPGSEDLIRGMRREKVSALKGVPDSLKVSQSVSLEHYTLPYGNLGKYQERALGIDKDGRVSQIITRTIDYD